MQQSPDVAAFNRFVKLLWFVLLVSVGLYWFILSLLELPPERSLDPLVQQILAAVAAATAVAALFLRFNLIARGVSEAAPGTDLSRWLARLRTLYIVCFVLAESIAVFGLVLYLLGAPRVDASWFFLGSAALFAACHPKSLESPPSL
jgi:hypothetical protein